MRPLTIQQTAKPKPARGCQIVEMTTIEVTVSRAMGIKTNGTLMIGLSASWPSALVRHQSRRYKSPIRVRKTTAYSIIPGGMGQFCEIRAKVGEFTHERDQRADISSKYKRRSDQRVEHDTRSALLELYAASSGCLGVGPAHIGMLPSPSLSGPWRDSRTGFAGCDSGILSSTSSSFLIPPRATVFIKRGRYPRSAAACVSRPAVNILTFRVPRVERQIAIA